MRKIHTSVHLPLPAKEAFALATDPSHATQWQSRFEDVQQTSTGPLEVGTTFRTTSRMLGRPVQNQFKVTEYEPGHIYATRGSSEYAEFVSRWTFEDEEGGSRLTVDLEATAKARLTQAAEALMGSWFERAYRRNLESDLESLTLLAESGGELEF